MGGFSTGFLEMLAREVTICKLDHRGQVVLCYSGEVVYLDETVIVARCSWLSENAIDLGPFCLCSGDIFIEYYYPGQWFNIFQIHDRAGVLKGWYCNITQPPRITDSEIHWRDLALDLLVLPDGQQMILDEDEFQELALANEVHAQARDALRGLQRRARKGCSPFGARPAARRP